MDQVTLVVTAKLQVKKDIFESDVSSLPLTRDPHFPKVRLEPLGCLSLSIYVSSPSSTPFSDVLRVAVIATKDQPG